MGGTARRRSDDVAPSPSIPVAGTPPFRRRTLANGLRVLVHPDPSAPLVTLNTLVRVGSRHEKPGRTGLAHLFEHLMFEGSPNIPRGGYDHWCACVGGDNNAWTTSDCTDYHITLPAEHLATGLWLESDRLLGFAVSSESLETQRRVVLEERAQTVDETPYGDLVERMRRIAYAEGHPYGWEPIGWAEDVAAATLEDMRDFYTRWYHPDNATLVLAGALDPDRAFDLVERWYGDIPARPAPPSPVVPSAAPIAGGRALVTADLPHAMAALAWHVPSVLDSRWPAFDLLATLLGDGDSSPLHHTLVYDREVASDVECYIDEGVLGSLLYITATGSGRRIDAGRLEMEVREVVARLIAEGVEREDALRSRRQRMTQIAYAMGAVSYRAERLAWYDAMADDPALALQESARCAAVGDEELASALQSLAADPSVVLYTPARRR